MLAIPTRCAASAYSGAHERDAILTPYSRNDFYCAARTVLYIAVKRANIRGCSFHSRLESKVVYLNITSIT